MGWALVGTAFPHLFHVLLQNEFEAVFLVCNHTFFVSITFLHVHKKRRNKYIRNVGHVERMFDYALDMSCDYDEAKKE